MPRSELSSLLLSVSYRPIRSILSFRYRTSTNRPSQLSSGGTSSSAFRGGGHTLGSDEVESVDVPDPNAAEGKLGGYLVDVVFSY